MTTKIYAAGADARLHVAIEETLGQLPPAGKWFELPCLAPVRVTDVRAYDKQVLLGAGRNTQGVYPRPPDVQIGLETFMDAARAGIVYALMLGLPTSTQSGSHGYFQFSAQPAVGSTISINGVTWTFVASGAAGNQTNIQPTLAATLTQLAADLNASTDPGITPMSYAAATYLSRLEIVHDTPSSVGDTVAIAAGSGSNAMTSGPTLYAGGSYQHVFTSAADVPSFAIEVGHPRLTSPVYRRYTGAMINTATVALAPAAPVNIRCEGMGLRQYSQGSTSIDPAPALIGLQDLLGSALGIFAGGRPVTAITGGEMTYANGVERPLTVTLDGWPDIIVTGAVAASGTISRIYSTDDPLMALAEERAPVPLVLRWEKPATGYYIEWYFPRVFFPIERPELAGPGPLPVNYNWIAEADQTLGYTARVRMRNPRASYAL